MTEEIKTHVGKVKVKNPLYRPLFQKFPDELQAVVAEKWPLYYYEYVLIIAEVTCLEWEEAEPYGATVAVRKLVEEIEAKYFIGNFENDSVVEKTEQQLRDVFGIGYACKYIFEAHELAFMGDFSR